MSEDATGSGTPTKASASRAKILPAQEGEFKVCRCDSEKNEVCDVCQGLDGLVKNIDKLEDGEPIACKCALNQRCDICEDAEEEQYIPDPRVKYNEEGETLLSPDRIIEIDNIEKEKKKDAAGDKLPDDFDDLTLKCRLFCELYTSSQEHFGNGTKAYFMAYGCDWLSAESGASRMLSNAKVTKYIDKLLSDKGLSAQYADKRLLELMQQRGDNRVALSAIQEFNKINNRNNTTKSEVELKGGAVHTLEAMSRAFLGKKEDEK